MAKTYEEKLEQVVAVLDELDDNDIITVHNNYCDAYNNADDVIYSNDDYNLDDIMGPCTFSEAAQKLNYSDYRYNDSCFWFNGYGNLVSSDNPRDNIFTSDIARYIVENEDSLEDSDIQEVIDSWEEEDEEDSDEE